MNISNVTEDLGCVSVAGPKARDILATLSPVFEEKFPFFSSKEVRDINRFFYVVVIVDYVVASLLFLQGFQ